MTVVLWLLGLFCVVATFPGAAYLARYGLRHRVRMLQICGGIVLAGFIVYLISGQNPIGALCDSIHSFFPSRGDFRTVPIGQSCAQKWVWWQSVSYFLFHWVVLVYILSVILAFFGIGLVNWLMIWRRLWQGRKVNVFCDYSSEAWLMP